MTIVPRTDPRSTSGPTSAPCPPGLRTTVSAAVARRLFIAGVRRLPVTVHLEGRRSSGRAARR